VQREIEKVMTITKERTLILGAIPLLVLLTTTIGGINLFASSAISSPFSTTTITSAYATTPSSQPSVAQDISSLFKGIEQFVAPSGYDQARQDPSYAVHIPFTDLGASPFDPSSISIPSGMSVIWFNDDDSEHSITFNNTSPEAIAPATMAPGGFYIHKFSTPGTYDYYDTTNPSSKGKINVGNEFESGQNMDMLVGGNALPFEAGKVGRTTFSFVPHSNVVSIPPTLSVTYNVAIADANGTTLYSNQFDDSDGILDLELVPTGGPSSYQAAGAAASNQTAAASNQTAAASNQTAAASNQTAAAAPHFVTWGPDLTDQQGVASDGAYHIMGPVMTENQTYTINVSIASVGNTAQPGQPSDSFTLPPKP
jgi:plastocyanin